MSRSVHSVQLISPTGTTPRKAESGRTCEETDCITRLSVYNSSKRCWQHQDTSYFANRVRGNNR